MAGTSDSDRPDPRCFVEVAHGPSLGVEVSTGRAWVGVDQQVGHGSADALYALTEEQYVEGLVSGFWGNPFVGECWRGEHEDLRLFEPRGGQWRPEHWFAARTRTLPPKFAGELWWHVDALGERVDGENVEVSRRLAARTGDVTGDADGVSRIAFRLVGDDAYPRPSALIAGLGPGSDRERARAVLGEPLDGGDVFAVEGVLARLEFTDGGLVGVTIERRETPAPPGGAIGVFLAALGEPEAGPRYRAAAELSGGLVQRWASSSGRGRRLLVFDGGVEMQVEDDRVLSVRIDVVTPATRAAVHAALGRPSDSSGATDLHRYGRGDVVVTYASTEPDATATEMTAILSGTSIARKFYRWRSGAFTMFLDVLGRGGANPLVEHVRDLPGVRLGMQAGLVAAVELDGTPESLQGFVDGLPEQPRRRDIPFGAPTEYGEGDDVWDFEQGHVHARSRGGRIIGITVSSDAPRGLPVQAWRFGRDSMDEWRRLSGPS